MHTPLHIISSVGFWHALNNNAKNKIIILNLKFIGCIIWHCLLAPPSLERWNLIDSVCKDRLDYQE